MRGGFKVFLSFAAAASVLIPARAYGEIHGFQDLSAVYYHVDGDKSRSFYPDNELDYLYEGEVDFKNPFLKDYELFGNIFYRSTNDDTIDTQDFSVERMYMGLRGQAKEFLLGDFYSNFSEYSVTNAVKGGKIVLGDDKSSSRLIMIGGIDTSKWEDLWETRQDDSAGRRFVWGSRLENSLFNKKLSLNLNYGGSKDDSAFLGSSASSQLINVFSVDGKYVLNSHLDFFSEIAQSFTDTDTQDSDAPLKGDRAMKFGANLNLKDYTLTSVYSRIGNYFNTTGGFSAQDLETLSFDGMWFLPLKMKFSHYLHMDKDNLSKNKTTTTKQINPGGKLSFTCPMGFDVSVGSDFRKRFTTDKTANDKTYTHTFTVARDFNILYASLGYTRTNVTDRVNASQEKGSDMYSLGLDGSFSLKNVKFTWNLAEDITRDAYREAHKSDFVESHSLGLKAVFPSTLRFEAKYSYNDNDYYINSSDSNISGYFISISRDLVKDLVFLVSYEHKGNHYTDAIGNYAERFVRARLNYKF